MDKYTKLYAWVWKTFPGEEFSIDQFRFNFPTTQAPKVIHDLIEKGYLERKKRGIYKAVEPKEFIKNITEHELDYESLEGAGKDYAFCEDTAVSIWTDGYYWSGFTKGFRPVHVAIRKRDVHYWISYFRKNGVNYTLEGERRTLYGQVYVLHPWCNLKSAKKNGLRVLPVEDVISFCMERKLAYEPALRYLNEKYGAGKVIENE